MIKRILSLLAMSCVLLAPAGALHGQGRPRRVSPPVEEPAPSPESPADGQYFIDTGARPAEPSRVFIFRTVYEGDTLAKVAARMQLPVDDLLRFNNFGRDESL